MSDPAASAPADTDASLSSSSSSSVVLSVSIRRRLRRWIAHSGRDALSLTLGIGCVVNTPAQTERAKDARDRRHSDTLSPVSTHNQHSSDTTPVATATAAKSDLELASLGSLPLSLASADSARAVDVAHDESTSHVRFHEDSDVDADDDIDPCPVDDPFEAKKLEERRHADMHHSAAQKLAERAPPNSGDTRVDEIIARGRALCLAAERGEAPPVVPAGLPMELPGALDSLTFAQIELLVRHAEPVELLALRRAGSTPDNSFLEPQTLTWRDVSYWEPDPGTGRRVEYVRCVSGYVAPSEILGVIGAPDSGVTPLLQCIAGRPQKKAGASGQIRLNGVPPPSDFSQLVGSLPKEEHQFAQMTVLETLQFSAKLRAKQQDVSDRVLHFRIHLLLRLLSLQHRTDSLVGDAVTRGLSGGERRRLWFLEELLGDHSVLLADLPTNGLDHASALSLFHHLRFFADNMKAAFVCSLAQASTELLHLADNLLLMCKGSCIYFGPVDSAEHHLRQQGFERPTGAGTSLPAFLEQLSAHPERFWRHRSVPLHSRLSPLQLQHLFWKLMHEEQQTKQLNRRSLGNRFMQLYQQEINNEQASARDSQKPTLMPAVGQPSIDPTRNETYEAWLRLLHGYDQSVLSEHVAFVDERQKNLACSRSMEAQLQEQLSFGDKQTEKPRHAKLPAQPSAYRASLWRQISMALQRQALLTYRNRGLWLGNFLKSCVIGVMAGTLFINVGTTQASIRTRTGLLFFTLNFISAGAVQLISVLNVERSIFYHQNGAGYLSGFAYYIASVLLQLPLAFIETFCFIVILYPLAGLTNGVGSMEFLFAYFVASMVNLVARSLALFGTAASSSQGASQVIVSLLFMLSQFFCGFMSPRSLIPIGWRWAYTISYMTYAVRGFAVSQFTGLAQMDCSDARGGHCAYPTGYDALSLYDMQETQGTQWILLLDVFWFWLAFNAATCFLLSFLDFRAKVHFEEPAFRSTMAKHNKAILGKTQTASNAVASIAADNGGVLLHVHPASSLSSVSSGKETFLAWKDVTYTVDLEAGMFQKPKQRELLTKTFGFASTGRMCALLGPSGSGKTTLLDVIAQMKSGGHILGDITLDGQRLHEDVTIAYVEQFSCDNELATIREAISFSVRLRRPDAVARGEEEAIVNEVLELFDLTHLQYERLGDSNSDGVSPEIRKKVSIAVEVVKLTGRGGLLLCDEPTTGLTATAALEVVRVLKQISKQFIVIVTLHQPGEEIVAAIDDLILCVAGQTAFFGALAALPAYLREVQVALHADDTPVPDSLPLAIDYAMIAFSKASSDGKVKGFAALGQNSAALAPAYQRLEQAMRRADSTDNHKTAHMDVEAGAARSLPVVPSPASSLEWRTLQLRPSASVWRQTLVLSHRGFITTLRDSASLVPRLVSTLFISFVVGTLFFQLEGTQTGALSFFSIVNMATMFAVMTAVVRLPEQIIYRALYYRETKGALYSPTAFVIARWLNDMPFVVVEVLLLEILIYLIAGLKGNFGVFFALLMGARLSALQITYVVCGVSTTLEMANSLVSVVMTISSLFSGFLIPKAAVPAGWLWLYYGSFMRYPVSAAAQNELREHDQFTCAASQQFPFAAASSKCPQLPDSNGLRCPLQCGVELLAQLGLSDSTSDLQMNIGLTYVFAAGFAVIALMLQRFLSFVKR